MHVWLKLRYDVTGWRNRPRNEILHTTQDNTYRYQENLDD